MNDILFTLFIDTIINEGAKQLYVSNFNGMESIFFQGKNGKKIQIYSGHEYITTKTTHSYLIQLGMQELIQFF